MALVRDVVLVQFLAQRCAIHAKHFCGVGEIAFAIVKHFNQQRFLNFVHDQAMQLGRWVTFYFTQVPTYRGAAGFG